MSYGVFVARSYPTVTLALVRKESGVVSIFSILNQSVQTLPEPFTVVTKLLPFNIFGVVQTPVRCIDKFQRLLKTRHVKNRELVPDEATLSWNLDPYDERMDCVYRMQCDEELQAILNTLVLLVNERLPFWIAKKLPEELSKSTPVMLSLNLYYVDELYQFPSFIRWHRTLRSLTNKGERTFKEAPGLE